MSSVATASGRDVRPDEPLPIGTSHESLPGLAKEVTQVRQHVPARGPATFFDEVRRGVISPAALQWLIAGFEVFDDNDGSISLERCLRLPKRKARRLERRDALICEAWRLLSQGGESRTKRGALLGAELDKFERANWREWKDLDDPPYSASELRSTLFRLVKSFEGEERPCNERLAQILAQTFGG